MTEMKQCDEAIRTGLVLSNKLTQRALKVAREQHDTYRLRYDKKLKVYVAKQVNHPNVDFRVEFSQKWLEGWHDIIKRLNDAENTAQDAVGRARVVNVAVVDDMDQGDPNISYDIKWWDHEMIEKLDRDQIQWRTGMVAGI